MVGLRSPDEVFPAYLLHTDKFDRLRLGERKETRKPPILILFVAAFSWILLIEPWVISVLCISDTPSLC